MSENVDKLKAAKEDLDHFAIEHGDILAKEPTIAHPFDQARKEAQRRYKAVTEGHEAREGIRPPHQGYVP